MKTKVNRRKVEEYLDDFIQEHPNYDSEVVGDYLALCDDFTSQEKDLFCQLLGY